MRIGRSWGLRDSKRLSPPRRRELALLIREHALAYGLGLALPAEIDAINILQATLLAMRRALQALAVRPMHIIIDGNKAPQLADLFGNCRIETLVRGDDLVPAISAASILAKTCRMRTCANSTRAIPAMDSRGTLGTPRSATSRHCSGSDPVPFIGAASLR